MKLKALLFALFVHLFSMTVAAYDAYIDGIYYSFDETEASVTSGNTKYAGSVVIPQTVTFDGNTYQVTSISSQAFYKCYDLTSISIPSSITSIGSKAFMDSYKITTIYITDLGAWCNISFWDTSANPLSYAKHLYVNGQEVQDLVIPETATKISNLAFNGNSVITSIDIPKTVTSIGNSAFAGCNKLSSVTIPESVTSIGNYAFDMCI